MWLFDVLYKVYFILPSFKNGGKIGKVYRHVLTRSFKKIFTIFFFKNIRSLKSSNLNKLNEVYRDKKLIVSLTSFRGRIDVVDVAIKCLLRQTVMPDNIILWLAREEYSEDDIPDRVKALRKLGVDIYLCENLMAHKKYIDCFERYADDFIITFDDDFYYEKHMLENLLGLKSSFPDSIVTNRAHYMRFDNQGELKPYRKWIHNSTYSKPSFQLFATGGVGTIYSPRDFPEETTNRELIKELCFQADDVWLKVMSLRGGKNVVTNARYDKDFITLPESQKVKLVSSNVENAGNDQQLRAVCQYFGISSTKFK